MLLEIFTVWKESVPLKSIALMNSLIKFVSSNELLKISSEYLEQFLRCFGRRVKKCYFEKKPKKGEKVTQLTNN